jgi:hypothetical protein
MLVREYWQQFLKSRESPSQGHLHCWFDCATLMFAMRQTQTQVEFAHTSIEVVHEPPNYQVYSQGLSLYLYATF